MKLLACLILGLVTSVLYNIYWCELKAIKECLKDIKKLLEDNGGKE